MMLSVVVCYGLLFVVCCCSPLGVVRCLCLDVVVVGSSLLRFVVAS